MKRNSCIVAVVLGILLASSPLAGAFSLVAKFNSTYTYTNTNVRMALNQASISMATSVPNSVTLSIVTSLNITNTFYSTTSSIFSLTLWPPNGVSTNVYLYAGDKLRATSSATNDCWLTVIYSGLDIERIHGTSNVIANTIGAASLDTNSVPSYAIQAGAVTQSKLATNSVNGSANITDYTITGVDIQSNSVDAGQIASTAVTNGRYTNAIIQIDADGRITYAASVPSSAVGTQGLISVVGIGNDGGGVGITNMGTSVFLRVHAAASGTNLDDNTVGITKFDTNYNKLLRLSGINSSAGSAIGTNTPGSLRVMMVSTTRVQRSTWMNFWAYLSTTNSSSSVFYNEVGITAQVSSNGTSWIDAEKANATQGSVAAGNGFAHPGTLSFPIPAGMYYQIYANAAGALTNHLWFSISFQKNLTESD